MIGFSGCGGVGGAVFDWRKEREGKQTLAPDVTERRAMMPAGARFFGRTDTFIIGSCRIDCRILCSFPTFKSPGTFAGREGAASKGQHGRTWVLGHLPGTSWTHRPGASTKCLFEAVLALSRVPGGGNGGSAPLPAQIP